MDSEITECKISSDNMECCVLDGLRVTSVGRDGEEGGARIETVS